MKIVTPSTEILTPSNIEEGIEMLKRIELAARTCYKSEGAIAPGTYVRICDMLIGKQHEAMIEHGGLISVRFICDRGVSHELVRHRVASFGQESTRYCNYSKDKFDGEIAVINPGFEEKTLEYNDWLLAMEQASTSYFNLLKCGASPQIARSVLPTCLKTEIVLSANPREWRHIFKLRCAKSAHPQMRELMIPLHQKMAEIVPILFNDITY